MKGVPEITRQLTVQSIHSLFSLQTHPIILTS